MKALAHLAIVSLLLVSPITPAQERAPDRGWLGVLLDPPERPPAGAELPVGVVIGGVVRGSPADRAGLRTDDRILAVGGSPVSSQADVIRLVSQRPAGSWVDVQVLRRAVERSFSVQLEGTPQGKRRPDLKVGWAGVSLVDVPRQLKEFWGGTETSGVLVGAFVEGGPAQRAGLLPGDLVLKFEEDDVGSAGELAARLKRAGDGNLVRLEVSRQGAILTVEMTLDPEPPPSGSDAVPR